MEYQDIEYILIVSNDAKEFYLDQRVACQCMAFAKEYEKQNRQLKAGIKSIQLDNISGNVLEVVIQYLHYKNKFKNVEQHLIPKFNIDPIIATQILEATEILKI